VWKIEGEIPLNLSKSLIIAKIRGEISLIDSSNVKIGDFAGLKRKNSLYFPRNELHSAYNGKISA
jgi:hypothetical protein